MILCLHCKRPLWTGCAVDPCEFQRRLNEHSIENWRPVVKASGESLNERLKRLGIAGSK